MTNHCRFTFVVLTEMSDSGVQHYHIYWFKHIVLVDCAVLMFCVKYRKNGGSRFLLFKHFSL